MKSLYKVVTVGMLITINQACIDTPERQSSSINNEKHAEKLMSGKALLPRDLSLQSVSCSLNQQPKVLHDYRSSEQTDYSKYGWEERIAHDWEYFSAQPSEGKIQVIDIKKQNNQYVYKYLSNGTQDDLFEPWSSSKVMAITAAMAKARSSGLKGLTKAGSVPFSDLVTSIHSYSDFGQSKASSNAIATYFINLVGRQKLTNYFSDGWLKLANQKVRIRGGYGEAPYRLVPNLWFANSHPTGLKLKGFESGEQDPLAQSYRCEECGLTGNKPQTTLAMAEWLKRLALHDRDQVTNFPNLALSDVEMLFYGHGHSQSDEKVGGMMKGIGQGLAYAIAETIAGENQQNPKKYLDDLTEGQWRIWQKIGWGPSETRGAAEYVLLAHVCLPHFQGGKEFTISAQVGIDGATEEDEAKVDMKMQSLLSKSIRQYFAGH
ncbi:MAG: hypothetical protein ABJI60_07735 [Kangiellaceae bacterium]